MDDLNKYYGMMGLDSSSTRKEVEEKYQQLMNQFAAQAISENGNIANAAKRKIDKLENVYQTILQCVPADNNKCSLCNNEFERNTFTEIIRTPDEILSIINKYAELELQHVCRSCFRKKYQEKQNFFRVRQERINSEIQDCINHIPILTTHTPLNWEYKTLGIVTGQTTTGTGFLSSLESSVADLLGSQSFTINTKLSDGEKKCFLQLRMKTLALGGNAVLATDLDYSEVGGLKGMLMVCASGTAVAVENVDVFSEDAISKLAQVKELKAEIRSLEEWGQVCKEKVDPFLDNRRA